MAGDQITISASQQIEINGDDAWVKLEVTSKVQLNESADDAINRVTALINRRIIDTITSHAQTIMEFEEKQ